MRLAARKPPNEIGINGSEHEFPVFCGSTGSFDIRENPCDLRRREIRIQQQPRLLGYHGFKSALSQFGAGFRSAAVLPDDRIANRRSGFPIPNNHGFALIRDSDRGDVVNLDAVQRGFAGMDRGRPNFLGVVLNPSGLGKVLREFHLADCRRPQVAVEHDCPA